MFHCLVIKVVCCLPDSLFILSQVFSFVNNFFYFSFSFFRREKEKPASFEASLSISLYILFVKHFFQKFFRPSRSCIKSFVSVVLFKRLDYFIISSVDCQQLIWIFWKLISFSVFQKQFLATACLFYHSHFCLSRTFLSFFKTF